ncbi:MAG: hypothetical protein JW984_07405 [Deltaproteobacteria bacterium]|uniref:Lipid A biosynthesis acyltransferase n=1 Tax=Candidatus Zymogenus saltonus TaxID=2844893 RepID=A0A9D8PP16_9DELT|nr:hypothetical protein [Candidatus Zymogenus saltonus]
MSRKKRSKRTYHLKRKIKAFTRRIYSWPAKPLFWIMIGLPEPVIRKGADLFGLLIWLFGTSLRRVALNNLKLVYGSSLTEKEIKAIAKESMKNLIRTFLECPPIMKNYLKIVEDIDIEGEEYIEKALENGKGVVALGSHTGNFLLMLTALTIKGYPISFVYKEPMDKGFAGHFWKLMRNLNLNPIPVKPRSRATKFSLRVLKKKEILWIAADQNVREGSIGVEFFGVKASTAKGPAVLALWSNAMILPMTIKRLGWLKHKITIKKPFTLETTGNMDEDTYSGLKVVNQIIEEMILDNPTEWWWIHNRWKNSYKYQ